MMVESSLPDPPPMPDEFQPVELRTPVKNGAKWFALNRGLAMFLIAAIALGTVAAEIVMRSTTGDSLGLDLSQNIAIALASIAALADSSTR